MPVKIHGKEYKTVAERVNEIHSNLEGDLSITTDIVSIDSERVIMKAQIQINGCQYTGHALEVFGSSMINKTSALENCETSAIGRALASAGYAGSEFASADEVANAISQQENNATKKQINLIHSLLSEVDLSDKHKKAYNDEADNGLGFTRASEIIKGLMEMKGGE